MCHRVQKRLLSRNFGIINFGSSHDLSEDVDDGFDWSDSECPSSIILQVRIWVSKAESKDVHAVTF